MNGEEDKAYFNALRTVVAEALREADPVRLLEIGAPADEYDPEIGTILPRLRTASSAEEVRTMLHEEFVRWFDADPAGSAEAYDGAAQRIWAFLQTNAADLDRSSHEA
jgi:hypothetical protein